jgi:hypothetical protein
MKNANHHNKKQKNMMKKLNKKNTMKKLTPDLFCTMRSCSNLSTMLEMVCVFFTVCLHSFKELHSQENSTFPVEWSSYINMTNFKTFSGSKIIQDLAETFCTIGEADLDALKECYGEFHSDDENAILRMILRKKTKYCRLNMYCLLIE